MDFIDIAIAVVAGLTLGWLIMRNKNVDYSKVHIIQLEAFKKNMRKGQLIDIRKSEQFEADHIKGARSFRPKAITSKYTKLRKDLSVYLYCQNGRKSKRVARKMAKINYSDIYVLDGGYDHYQ
jgi:rhodanese-related sulfurtransferase